MSCRYLKVTTKTNIYIFSVLDGKYVNTNNLILSLLLLVTALGQKTQAAICLWRRKYKLSRIFPFFIAVMVEISIDLNQ